MFLQWITQGSAQWYFSSCMTYCVGMQSLIKVSQPREEVIKYVKNRHLRRQLSCIMPLNIVCTFQVFTHLFSLEFPREKQIFLPLGGKLVCIFLQWQELNVQRLKKSITIQMPLSMLFLVSSGFNEQNKLFSFLNPRNKAYVMFYCAVF